MSFKKFQTYLEESLSNPRLLKSDWEFDKKWPPHNPEILKWTSTDSEEAFTSVLDNPKDAIAIVQKMSDSLKSMFNKTNGESVNEAEETEKLLNDTVDYYLSNPIEYSLNEYRFRTDSFSLNIDGNLFLGCSDTFGVGHHLEHTWPYILTQLRFPNYKIYNLGIPGSGSDTNFRHLALLKNSIKIKNIFHWLPLRSRFEHFIKDTTERNGFSEFNTVAPQWETNSKIFSNLYIKNGLSTDVARNLNILKNISAIKEISNEIKIPYYISNFDCVENHKPHHLNEVLNYLDKNNIPRTLLARDISHDPIITVAETVANFLFLIDSSKKII